MQKLLLTLPLIAVIGGCSDRDAKACTPPRTHWQRPHNFVGLQPMMIEVAVDRAGHTYWNGKPVSDGTLRDYLRLAHGLNPAPRVFLHTEMGAPCNRVEFVRHQFEDALKCSASSQCAEGIMSVWRELPSEPGTPVS